MTRAIRLLLPAAALVALATVAIGSASGAANGSKRFEAQFQESNVLRHGPRSPTSASSS